MNIGDTIVWCPPGTRRDHLWIVISDPNSHGGKCIVINLTHSTRGKNSFVLRPGQHRWIYKDSDVNFGDAFATTVDRLEAEMRAGTAIPHDPMAAEIVSEIIIRARTHPAFHPVLRNLLP